MEMLQEKRNSLVLDDEVGEVFLHLSTDEPPDEPGAPSPILPASINCTSNGPPDKAESPGPMPSAPVEEVEACPAESSLVPRPATINSPVEEACPTRESQDFHQDHAFVSPEGRSISAPANSLNVGDFRRGMVVAAFAIVLFVCIAAIAREIAVMKERIAYLEGGLGASSLNGSIASDVHQEVAGMSHRLAAVERQLFELSLGVNNTSELNQEVEVMKQRLNSLHGLLSGYMSDTADSIEEVVQEVTFVQGLIRSVAINTSSLGQELAGMKQESVGEQALMNSLARNTSYLSQQFANVKQGVASLRSIEEKFAEQFTLVTKLNRTMARRPKVTNFTAGNGTFHPEEGTRFIRVRLVGGGAAGGPSVCKSEPGGSSVFGPFSAGGGGLYHQGDPTYDSGSYGYGGLPNISDDGIASAIVSSYTGSGHKIGDDSIDINCWNASNLNCDYRTTLVTRFMNGVRNGGSRGLITTYVRGASPNQYYAAWGGPGGAGAYVDVFILQPAAAYEYVVGRGGTVRSVRHVTTDGTTYDCTDGTPYHYSAYGNSIDYKTIAPKPGGSGFVEVTEFF